MQTSIAACITCPATATDRYEAARETVRKFLNAPSVDNIVFTKGGTEAINLVSYSWLAPYYPAR